MEIELARITPALARKWLELNKNNRPLRPTHVETLRASFARGEYVQTHQGIAFDQDNNLIDGQHRLHAIAQMPKGFFVTMLVTRGLERDRAFVVIDTVQAKRSTSDVLRVDRNVGETANFLARLFNNAHAITPTYVAPFARYVQSEVTELLAHCGTAARTWSSAPVKAAAVLQMKNGHSDYVKTVYAAMVTLDFDAMPRCAKAVFRAQKAGEVRASFGWDLFARGLKIFDPANTNLSKVQISDLSTTLAAVRDILARDINTAPPESALSRAVH